LTGLAANVSERAAPGEYMMAGDIAASLQGSGELLALAEEAGQLGLFEWLVQTGTIRVSANFQSLYGFGEFDGRYDTWLQCLFREDVLRVVDNMDKAFAAQARHWQAEFRITRQTDGALRWMEARSVIFYDEQRRPIRVAGVHVDITEEKRALVQLQAFTESLEERVKERTRALEEENEARRKAEEALRQVQKMEAVGQLTGGIAHDFNNLLTIILGGLDTIGRQASLLPATAAAARIARARDMALHGAQRAATLTTRLLAFARQQPLVPKAVNPNKLVGAMAEFLQRTLGETTALETVLAAGLWRAYVDEHQLENALLNLALNARDAMPGGGKLSIETANCYLDTSYVAALPEPVAAGQYVMIAVADTGSGMDKSTLERVFEPFFTTKELGKGTGLGLSQVYGFVRQSAGHVKIYSEPGEGTTLKIYLPRHVGSDEHQDEHATVSGTGGAIGAETILVAEDDEELRNFTAEILAELGYRVFDAPTGAVALEIINRDENIDLLFTDVVMRGGINGRVLADEATRRRPGLKVLFTTGYTRNAIIHHGRLDPGVNLIGKPYTPTELSARIRAILDERA
jgi:PAS domain S-box-containing protein